MTDDATYDAVIQNRIGALNCTNIHDLVDVQSADDFQLTSVFNITRVTADFISGCASADDFPGDGVLIEFFEDIKEAPAETPAAAFIATPGSSLTVTPFEDTLFGLNGLRFAVDLTNANINLGSGSWWVSIVPVHDADPSTAYWWVRTIGFLDGNQLHVRDGGIDHGNGLQGLWGADDWTLLGEICVCFDDGGVAMRVEGTRPADLDGDGSVGVADLLILLGSWGQCPPKGDCPADIDGDGSVGVGDFLILLGQWG